jgi:hypothetical protein
MTPALKSYPKFSRRRFFQDLREWTAEPDDVGEEGAAVGCGCRGYARYR